VAIFLKSIPTIEESIPLLGGNLFTNSGFFLVKPIGADKFSGFWWMVGIGVATAISLTIYSSVQKRRVGRGLPVGFIWLACVIIGPALYFLIMYLIFGDQFVTFQPPEITRFSVKSEWTILPEFLALLLALTLYTSSFIAEIVRAGILSVSSGQREASSALGLSRSQMLKLVVVPQAMRVIVPPLTSQYLNLTKNSSLGFAIGFYEVTALTMGTIPSQEGAALQGVVMAMAIYLSFSLLISMTMNFYNRSVRLQER
jgi:general L-amino acid transport system permease protein